MIIKRDVDIYKLGFVIIKDYPKYAINKNGIIISLTYNSKSNFYYIINPVKEKSGYIKVKLFNNKGKRKTLLLHRLIAKTFIPNPNNYPEINHKDYNRSNNSVDNLEWCDRDYNNKYSAKNHNHINTNKIKIRRVNIITNEIMIFNFMSEAVDNSNITFTTLYKSLNNINYITNNMYKFYYA